MSDVDSLIGQVIGNYEITARIGEGGMGSVYQAWHSTLDRPVAMKFLNINLASNPTYVDRFMREAKAAARLNHPHLIGVYDASVVDGVYYLVMEFVKGVDLNVKLKKGEIFSEEEAIELGRQAISALGYAHKEGLVHRDIKPANLILSEHGNIKLGDLGLAKWSHDAVNPELTQVGEIMGTPYYISPEQIQDPSLVDHRADIYSMGATLFHMVTGRTPYAGKSSAEILSKHLSEPPPAVRKLRPEVSDELSQIIERMMAKDMGQRYQSMEEVEETLAAVGHLGKGVSVSGAPGKSRVQQGGAVPASARDDVFTLLKSRMVGKQDFPSRARTVDMISKLSSLSDDASVDELTNTILSDFALTNKLLKVVNTVYYSGYGGKISTVSRAVMVLGLAEVKNAALSLALFENMVDKSAALEVKEAAMEAFMSGVLAKNVSKQLGLENTEEAFICAAFHSLGSLLVSFYLPEKLDEIRQRRISDRLAPEEASRTVLGMSFEEIGMRIATESGFPDHMIETMKSLPAGKIQRAKTAGEELRNLVCFANELSSVLNDPESDDASSAQSTQQLLARFEKCFDIPDDKLNLILKSSQGEVERFSSAFNLSQSDHRLVKRLHSISGPRRPATSAPVRPSPAPPASTPAVRSAPTNASSPPSDPLHIRVSGDTEVSFNSEVILTKGISDVTNAIIEDCSLNDALLMILEVMYRALSFHTVLFCIANPKTGSMEGRHGLGPSVSEVKKSFKFPIQPTSDVFGSALQQGTDLFIHDVNDPQILPRIPDWYLQTMKAKTFILLPIIIKKKPLGMIYMDKLDRDAIAVSKQQMNHLATLRNQAILAIRKASG